MKKLWSWLVGLFALLGGLFLYERNRRQKAESELSNQEYKAEDQLLKYKQDQSEASIQEQKRKIEEDKKHAQATQENQTDLTPEQVEEYWKNRNPK